MADVTTAGDHLRRLLPERVELEEEIDTLQSDGREDQEFSVHLFNAVDGRTGQRLERTVKLIDAPRDTRWFARLKERLSRLMSGPLAGVIRPLEVGYGEADGRELIWIMSDRVDHRLSDHPCLLGNGLEENRCLTLMEGLLQGLMSLHGVGLPHGALSPTSIGSFTQGDLGERLWITDAETGPLEAWSKGEMRATGAMSYHPPESAGRIPEPSTKGDVYAIGLIGCQVLLGKGGDPTLLANMSNAAGGDLRPSVRGRLKQHGKGHRAFSAGVVDKLLNPDPAKRPTAEEALGELVRLRHQSRLARPEILVGVLAAMLLVLAGMGIMYWQDADQFGDYSDLVEAEVGTLKPQLDDCLATIGSLERILAGDQGSIRATMLSAAGRIEDVAKKLDAPPGLKVIQARWMGSILDLPAALKGNFDKMRDAVDEQEDGRAHLAGWVKALEGRYAKGCEWFDSDDSLRQHYSEFAEEPWNKQGHDAFDARLDALDRAAADWKKWAEDDDLTVAELKVEIGRASDAERKILNEWLTQIGTFNPRLELLSGKAAEGWGKTRQVRIRTDSSDKSRKVHKWKSPRRAVYTPNRLSFDWTLGDTVRIYMYGPRSTVWLGARPEMIDQTFDGPLALWKAARTGRVSEAGNELRFRIEGVTRKPCPGPPGRKPVPVR